MYTGAQEWILARGELEIRRDNAAHWHRQEEARLAQELALASRNNEVRRQMFWLLVTLLVVVLVTSGAVGILHDNEETRRWAQNIVTTMIGGLLGAVAGYFTAKGGA
ncbi:MAG: hypothetical protein QM692_17105 [Thermomicrobiales bacterium]